MKKHGSKKKDAPKFAVFNPVIFDGGRFGVPFHPDYDIWEMDPQITLEDDGSRLRISAYGPAANAGPSNKLTPYIAHVYGFGGQYKYQSRFLGQKTGDMMASALFGYLPRPVILKIRALQTGFYLLHSDPDQHIQLVRISEDLARSLLHSSFNVEGFDPMGEKKKEPTKVWYEQLDEYKALLKTKAKADAAMMKAEAAQAKGGLIIPVMEEIPAWAAPYANTYTKLTEESKNMLKVCQNEEQAIAILGAYAKGLEQGQEHAVKAAEQKFAQFEAEQYAAAQTAVQELAQQGFAGDSKLAYQSESTMIWEQIHQHAQKGTFEDPKQRKKILLAKALALKQAELAAAPAEEPKRNLKLKQVK